MHVFSKESPPQFPEGVDVIMAWTSGQGDDDLKTVSVTEVQATKMLRAPVTAREADDEIAIMRCMLKADLLPLLKIGWYMAEGNAESPFAGLLEDMPVDL